MNTRLEALQKAIDAEQYAAIATVVEGEGLGASAVIDSEGTVLEGSLPDAITSAVQSDAIQLMSHEQSQTLRYDETSVFIESIAPPQDLLIFGAVHIGQALTKFASLMGYRVTVVDARQSFATEERFTEAHRVIASWPEEVIDQLNFDERTWVVVLSHDARHEDPVLEAALKSNARYIGAMGSRRTHRLRAERLAKEGFGKTDIDRVFGPIGLDIGAETPEEVAVSILAEMTTVRYGSGTGLSLKGEAGRIHPRRAEEPDRTDGQ